MKEELLSKGFKVYEADHCIDSPNIKYHMQKRYMDEEGTKYFITVDVWDWSWTDKVPYDESFEFTVQLYQTGTHAPLNLSFSWKHVEDVEKVINALFESGLVEHYEKYQA